MFKRFNNLKIGVRIIVGFFVIVVIAGAVGIVGILNLNNVQSSYAFDYINSTNALEYVERISSHFQQERVNIYGYALASSSQESKDYYASRITEHEEEIAKNINYYYDILEEYDESEVKTELELLNKVKTTISEFETNRKQILKELNNGSITSREFIELISKGGEVHNLASNADSAIEELIGYNINYAKDRIEANRQEANNSIITMIIVLAAGVVLAIVLGFGITRSISSPISKIVEAAERLAAGDVSIQRSIFTKDELGKLAAAFAKLIDTTREQVSTIEHIADGDLTVSIPIRSEKDLLGKKLSEMVQSLNNLVMNISSAAEQVSAGAKQISDSSMSLSQGATEQASSIEELTTSIEEISSKTNINAENANQANDLAKKAKDYAVKGNMHMKDMLKAMEEINESSGNINRIIKVIDDIAFQTNILALNAAVEAARAGQHGKGFAVVAEEVRNLAGRSANAAKETTTLIEDSIKKVEVGTRIANETAEALERIVDGVDSVSNLVSDIQRSSSEQAAAIAQVNQGIMQVSQVVNENSATSEESAAASEELSSQAEALKHLVDKFKLKSDSSVNNDYDGLGPDVIKMFEKMSESKNSEEKHDGKQDVKNEETIILNDNDFGKY